MHGKLFKYNINHYFSLLPRTVSTEEVISILKERYGISETEFGFDRFLEAQSGIDVPMERLLAYAQILDVPYYKLIH